MTTLTVTARGQVTFRKDVLQHLGVHPGEKIELDKLPDGCVAPRGWQRPAGRSIISWACSQARRGKSQRSRRSTRPQPPAGLDGNEDHRRHQCPRPRRCS